jgi:hypothetical protein
MSRLPCAWVWWFGGGWHQSVDMIWEGRGLENMRGTVVSCRTQANNSSAEPLLPSDQIPQLVKCNHVVLHDEASSSIVDHNRDAAPPTPETVLPSRVPRHIVRLDLQRQLLLFRSSWGFLVRTGSAAKIIFELSCQCRSCFEWSLLFTHACVVAQSSAWGRRVSTT